MNSSQILIFVIVLFSLKCIGQPSNLDSLLQIRDTKDPISSQYWETTVDLANYYIYHDLEKAKETIEVVFSDYVDRGYSFDKCYHRHHLLRCWVNHGNNKLKDAIRDITKAEDLVKNCRKRKDEIEIQINKASLLIATKDSTASSYVQSYMAQIDTTLDRDEKIAWIMGKKYLGDLEEEKGFFRIALGHYLEVIESGILNEIKQYRLGIIKGIARASTELGDYDYALKRLNEITTNQKVYTHQYNNILIAKAINYYKKEEYDKISLLTNEILRSDNLMTQDKIEVCWLRIKTYLKLGSKDKAHKELDKVISLKNQIDDSRLLARINLLEAEVSEAYGSTQRTNALLERYSQQGGGSKKQNLKANRLWLTNNVVGVTGQRLEDYLDAINSANKEKSASQMHEMMAIFKVEKEKERSAFLENKLENEQVINSQRGKALFFFGISTILSFLLWILSKRNAKVQKQLNRMLQLDKERLSQRQVRLENDKERLVFENQDLVNMNQTLINQKEQKIESQPNTKLEVKTRDKIHFLELSTILYIKADNNGSRLFLDMNKSLWTDTPLKYFVQDLSEKGFVRIHRAATVNLSQIEWINHATLKMNNGQELKVSRTYKDEILNLFKSHSPS